MVAAALRHGLATPHGGVGDRGIDRGIDFCKERVLVLCDSGIVLGGALLHMHTGAGLTQENWQILSTTGQALPFIVGGHFQVDPKQLEESGWVRAVGGFVVIESSTSSSSLETLQARVKHHADHGTHLHFTDKSGSS